MVQKNTILGLENNFFKITKNAPHYPYLLEEHVAMCLYFLNFYSSSILFLQKTYVTNYASPENVRDRVCIGYFCKVVVRYISLSNSNVS